ncbi:hypothetical protein [Actinacidiphila oryziradicis]|uniref:hypothetical protein n=1 Tax=Actinacidiphila oryziradicis TaxID=2571141 RepID=UPI00145F82EA|nr:hypothetical protein [Actinacidiphila oryziradicis]
MPIRTQGEGEQPDGFISNAAPDRAHFADKGPDILTPPTTAGDQCRTRTGADRPACSAPPRTRPASGRRQPRLSSPGD